MVTIISLWLPILLSAVIVFIVSSIIHMVLGYHNNEFAKLPREDEVMDALRPFSIPPGEYVMPRASSMKEMGTPEFIEKITKGPAAFMTVVESGPQKMGLQLTLWFVNSIVVGIFAAYISTRALAMNPAADYLDVFRFVGCTAFIAYSVALWQNSIWYKRSWITTVKSTFDGLVYALLTAGTFGWLWPS